MAYNPPTVSGEETVNTGRAYAVESYSDGEPGVQVVVRTGNGDDGLGVTQWWANTTIDTTQKWNVLLTVSGEKVSAEAEIIGLSGIGTPLEGNGESLLGSDEFVIVPDLFDSSLSRVPDQVFAITTSAPAADQVFEVLKLAAPPDQTFEVVTFAEPADQIFDVKAIDNLQVAVAEPPFLVTVFAEPADQIFEVIAGAPPPDQIIDVYVGPSAPDVSFEVLTIERLEVTTSWAPPDDIFAVTVGPTPPATPDQIFGVSVGGPGAPPIPDPNVTFDVTVGIAVPDQIFSINVIEQEFTVTAGPQPFVVTVGPTPPDQIFDVTVSAAPATVFDVTVGPDLPDQTFGVLTIETFEVVVLDAPASYNVVNDGASAYQFTGNGYSLALNPDLSHTIGQLVNFNVNAPGHPFWVCDVQATGGSAVCSTSPTWADQMDNNGTEVGQVRVRWNTPGTYFYNCSIHSAMNGRIVVPSLVYAYDVTNSGASDYIFNGEGFTNGADITLSGLVGERFDFQVNAPGHPFWVKDTNTGGAGNLTEAWADYLYGNGSDSGLVSVVFNTPGTYFYQCQYHSGMVGQIIIS